VEEIEVGEKRILQELFDAVLEGDSDRARAAAQRSLEAGIPPLTAINEGLTPGIREVGDRFGRLEMFLPEMVLSADAMEAAVAVLEPHFSRHDAQKKGKVLIGTVKGDIHDIGKNIVIALLKVNGYEVIDLGRDVPATDFIDKAVAAQAEIVGMSALLTTSLPIMRDVIQMMVEEGVRERFKVLIGGGPTGQEFADQIGADGYGANAYEAVRLCDRMLGHGGN
jgi:5-methyltetrahydrofolate--homocysteine methyltransferase